MNLKELQSTGKSEFLQVLPTPEGGKEEGGVWMDQQESGRSHVPRTLGWGQGNLEPEKGQRDLRNMIKVC